MKLLLCLILFTFTVAAQEAPKSPDEIKPEPAKCVHDLDEDFYDNIRHTGAVQITHANGRSVTVVAYRKNLIDHRTYQMDGRSRIPKDFYVMNLQRRWFLLICLKHQYLLVAEQIKK